MVDWQKLEMCGLKPFVGVINSKFYLKKEIESIKSTTMEEM
jgi:hypothetical protein